MEQQNVQVEEGIRLSDIFKLLLSKIKILILAILIGGVLGGAFAVWRTYDVNYYGTKVEFYVNPEKSGDSIGGEDSQYGVYGAYGRHVMDNMVKLLESESFSELMMLDGETLPDPNEWVTSRDDKETVAKFMLAVEEAKNVNLVEKQTALDFAIIGLNDSYSDLASAKLLLDEEWLELNKLGVASGKTFNEKLYESIKDKPEAQDLNAIYDGIYSEAQGKVTAATAIYNDKKAEVDEAMLPVETALNEWRKLSLYKSTLSLYQNAISFSYLDAKDDYEDANNLARSFIYVNISILNDKEEATKLLEKVKVIVPAYVEANMTIPTGYDGTNCQRITRTDNVELTNPQYTTNQAIKYGLLAGIAAFLIVCIAIIITDRSDKRLRDTEIISKKFNVPLLGIVPSIEELKVEQPSKKKNDKKNSKEAK